MNNITIVLLAVFLLFAGCEKENSKLLNCGLELEMNNEPINLSVLFIGNSHTYYNDMPEMVGAIARSMGDHVYTEMSAPGGYDFERHYKLDATISAINSRNWDYIVLQESGWRTALPPSVTASMIYPYADSLNRVIRANTKTAKLILYLTNGYIEGVNAFGDTDWCKQDPQVCNYEGMQEKIKGTYLHLANQLNAEIAPCGVLWKILKSKNNTIQLHDPDNIHPSIAGSYANAIAIYSVIRRKPLAGVFVPKNIKVEDSELIQHTISAALFDCNPSWENF